MKAAALFCWLALLVACTFASFEAATPTTCTYLPNMNITAEDMVPPKFTVSSYDCCVQCANHAGCMAAIYSNYNCHLKAATGPVEDAEGPTIVQMRNAPPYTPPPTSAPPTPEPTPQPTPVPPTPIPTSAPPQYELLVRYVDNCRYDSCDFNVDQTCRQHIFIQGECTNKNTIVWCREYDILVQEFQGVGCSGKVTNSSKKLDYCVKSPSGENPAYGWFCDRVPKPTQNLPVVRRACPYSCTGPSSQCTISNYKTGQCNSQNPYAGKSQIAETYPEYIVYQTFDAIGCVGPSHRHAWPVNTCYYLDEMGYYSNNVTAAV